MDIDEKIEELRSACYDQGARNFADSMIKAFESDGASEWKTSDIITVIKQAKHYALNSD